MSLDRNIELSQVNNKSLEDKHLISKEAEEEGRKLFDNPSRLNFKKSYLEISDRKEAASAASQRRLTSNQSNYGTTSSTRAKAVHADEEEKSAYEPEIKIIDQQNSIVPKISRCKNILYDFIAKPNITTEVLYPIGITGLLIHDIVKYTQDPSTQFGANLGQVISGTAFHNPFYGASTLFNTRKGSTNYWLPLTTLLSVSFGERVFSILPINTPEFISNKIATAKSYASCIYNVIPSPMKSFIKLMGMIGSANGWYHFLKFIYWKNTTLLNYFHDKNNCHQRAYVYLSHIVDYACTLCGDWEFVNPLYADSNQYCLDALLAHQSDPDVMLQNLRRLADPVNRGAVLDINLSGDQSWLEQPKAGEIFETLGNVAERVNRFTLDLPAREYSEGQVQIVGNLIERIKPDELIIRNQNFGSYAPMLFRSINRAAPQSVLIDNLGIDDSLGHRLFNSLSNSTKSVSVPNNNLSDSSMGDINRFTQNSETKAINLDSNPVHSVAPLFQNINNTRLENIGLSNMEVNRSDAAAIGQAINQQPIKNLRLSNSRVDDDKLIGIGEGFGSPFLEDLDLSNNQFGDWGISCISEWPANLRTLNISNNPNLTAKGFIDLFQKLRNTCANLTNLILDDNYLEIEVYEELAHLVRHCRLESLQINNCAFTDKAIDAFCKAGPGDSKYLTDISFNRNECTEKGYKQIAKVFSNSNVKNLNGNCSSKKRIDVLSTYKKEMRGKVTTQINAGGSKVEEKTAISFINQLPGSNTQLIDAHDTVWNDALNYQLIRNLITHSPSIVELNQDVLSDKTELTLFYHSKPATNITTLNLADTLVTRNSSLPLSRVTPFSKTTNITLPANARISSYPKPSDSGQSGIACIVVSVFALIFAARALGYFLKSTPSNVYGLFAECRRKPMQTVQEYQQLAEVKPSI